VEGLAGRAANERAAGATAGAEIEAPAKEGVSGGVDDTTTGTTVLSDDGRGRDLRRRSQKACATVLDVVVSASSSLVSLLRLLLLTLPGQALLLLPGMLLPLLSGVLLLPQPPPSVFIFFFGADDGMVVVFRRELELPVDILAYHENGARTFYAAIII
jgi:hypothetical protein